MVFFKPGCPTSTLVLGLCPPTPPHSHAAGMRDAAGTDPAQPSHASPILPAPSRSHSHLFMQQHPNSFLAPDFFPTACLEPSGNHVRSSPLAVPPGSLCPPLLLLRQQPLGWMQGCFPPLSRMLLLGKQPRRRGKATGDAVQQLCASLRGCRRELSHHGELQKCSISLEAH